MGVNHNTYIVYVYAALYCCALAICVAKPLQSHVFADGHAVPSPPPSQPPCPSSLHNGRCNNSLASFPYPVSPLPLSLSFLAHLAAKPRPVSLSLSLSLQSSHAGNHEVPWGPQIIDLGKEASVMHISLSNLLSSVQLPEVTLVLPPSALRDVHGIVFVKRYISVSMLSPVRAAHGGSRLFLYCFETSARQGRRTTATPSPPRSRPCVS